MKHPRGLLEALRKGVEALEGCRARYALVGAVAISARTEPRFTRDVDLAVAVDSDEAAERIVSGLIRTGYVLRELFQHESSGTIVTARLVHSKAQDIFTDLLFRTCGIEAEIVECAETLPVAHELSVKVAGIGHLIAMKVLSRSDERPQDESDLAHLLKAASSSCLEIAEAAVALIQSRGKFHDRGLVAELCELRKKYASR